MGDSELMMLSDALEHRGITNTVSTDTRTVTVPEDEVDSKEELQEILEEHFAEVVELSKFKGKYRIKLK